MFYLYIFYLEDKMLCLYYLCLEYIYMHMVDTFSEVILMLITLTLYKDFDK